MATFQVGAASDDASRRLEPSYWSLDGTSSLGVGADALGQYQVGGGMRFTAITIPQGSIIDAAYLTLRARYSRTNVTVNSRISAEDVDDAITFADDSAAFDTRWAARTIARVDWDGIGDWTADTDYDSPEIKTVIQEIIDRNGWSSGQDIVIFWDDFEDRTTHATDTNRLAYTYLGSTTYAPKLVITWTPPAGQQILGSRFLRGLKNFDG